MKKIILALSLAVVAGTQVQTAQAADREWAVAGKVLTGVAAASIVTHVLEPRAVYCAPAPCVVVVPSRCPAPVICAPPITVCAPVVCAPLPYVRTVPVVGLISGHGYRPHYFGRYYDERSHR